MAWTKDNLPDSVKNKEWNDDQKDVFLNSLNRGVEKGLSEDDATKIAEKVVELKNASQYPTAFYARHMAPGLCKYDSETVLVDVDAMKRMIKSFVGKPIYIGHKKVDLEKIKEEADGYIAESFYNDLDGWAWVKILAIGDPVYQAIGEGWAVSNSYKPTEFAEGGTQHNCPYDRKILNGMFTHLAIVPDPRYEGACIYTPEEFNIYQAGQRQKLEDLNNSKSKPEPKGKKMFQIFKSKKEEVTQLDGDESLTLDNGKTVTLKELTDSYAEKQNAAAKKNEADDKAEKKEEKKEESKDNADDQMVKVGDSEMKLSELISDYTNMKNKKNSADEDKKDDDKKDKDNESDDDADKKKKADDEKSNSKDEFEELKNAHTKKADVSMIETSANQLQRGQNKYGSAKK